MYIQTFYGMVHDTYKNSLVGKQCANRVTVTGVRNRNRKMKNRKVGGGNNNSIGYGVDILDIRKGLGP